MQRLCAGTGRAPLRHRDELVVLLYDLVVTDVSVAHPAGRCGSLCTECGKKCNYGGGRQVAGDSFASLSLESYGHLGRLAMQFLRTLADAAASSATAGFDVTTFSFVTGALGELSVALVKRNEVVYREALHVYATAGRTAACVGATVPTVDPE
jgi:hypothetical protein